ncbi:hypothetical protein ABFS83_10G061600 [Erythranthe nasuta]
MSEDSSFMDDGKRLKIDTQVQTQMDKYGDGSFAGGDEDRISQLSDGILVDIISLLPLKEAGRTSILSPRWKNLWKRTPSLDFDSQNAYRPNPKKLLNWVDSVIKSHKSPTLKDFRICFPLDRSSDDSITRWLEFAFSRQVEMLELNFERYPFCYYWYEYYRFPKELFAPSNTLFDFSSLKGLGFKCVNMRGGAIELLLLNCPLLEQLILRWPGRISKIEVCGSSLVLKHLEIVNCTDLESLKISAPRLASLRVTTLAGLLLENVPMLVHVTVGFNSECVSMKRVLSVFSCCVSQLVTLKLEMRMCNVVDETEELCELAEMPRLKKLIVEYDMCDVGIIGQVASWKRAFSYVHEFVLVDKWNERRMRRNGGMKLVKTT